MPTDATFVLNLSTGTEYLYTLPPRDAVVTAYRQHVLGDYNWWTDRDDLPTIVETQHTVSCGDFCAKVNHDR